MDLQEARRNTPPSGPGLIWGTTRHTSRMISLGQLLEIPQRSSDLGRSESVRVGSLQGREQAGEAKQEQAKCDFHVVILEAGPKWTIGVLSPQSQGAQISYRIHFNLCN